MKANPFNINLSELDEKRFGIRTAHAANIAQENIGEVLEFCKENGIVFLVARCETREISSVHAMQEGGYLLMDTIIRFSIEVDKMFEGNGVEIFPVHPVQAGEEDEVRAIALETFRGYRGHYHADERLDAEKCDGIYASIAYDACFNKDGKTYVNVCKINGELVAFDILSNPSSGVGEAVLKCVSPKAQKLGVGYSFIRPAKDWYRSKGVQILYGSTQITNTASIKHMIMLGFQPSASLYTFHKWFDK